VKADDLQRWQMDIRVLDDNPLYRGKTFRLNFRFSQNYPIEVCTAQLVCWLYGWVANRMSI